MTTAKHVFDTAMAIMDEIDDTGETVNDDTFQYYNRTLPIINALQNELYRYSDTFVAEAGVRPVCTKITGFDDQLGIDDFLAGTVLPYGLAYHLLATDGDNTVANLCLARYQALLASHGSAIPAVPEDIVDVYGGARPGSDGE